MNRLLLRAVIGVVLAVALVWAIDYVSLRVRVARGLNAFDTVDVNMVLQVPQKGNKAEYIPEAPQTQTCVRSIFPHLGDQPCWYLRRHTQQQINFYSQLARAQRTPGFAHRKLEAHSQEDIWRYSR